MATLVLQAAGQAVGGFFGGPLGAILGRAAGGIAGSIFDQALFGKKPQNIEGPRLKELQLMGSSEGAPIPRIYGRMRISGQIIWATRFEEVTTTRRQKTGSKGSIGQPKAKITEYSYYANFAVGLCQGTINRIGRVWADGKEIDISGFTHRLHKGGNGQQLDSLIVSKQGADGAPAYRGTAYIVFEHLPLERFGNRIPQLSFEVFRSLDGGEDQITAVNIIPGATEFGYEPEPVARRDGWGGTIAENTHTLSTSSDLNVSLNQLQETCRNIQSAALVVSWFGDDLRCENTKIYPGVETRNKNTDIRNWEVSGVTRSNANLISLVDGKPAFGSTPDDVAVINAISDLASRGIKPVFYPFIMMDIPNGSSLPDPHVSGQTQKPYPWRGRITCYPGPGRAGTPDKTAAINSQVDAFFGNATPSDFSISGGKVVYSGPADWGYRRMILHYANLCSIAGGLDAFLIGSELRSLTILRDQNNSFPVVAALEQLASEVSAILPNVKISYAADWSEYFGYQPDDGSGDVFFHLDPLWSSPDIDFIGIDNYMPLSDWRDGSGHQDMQDGANSIYDLNYLKTNITGGEGFDWYYASSADRELQVRTPISDGAGKPWVFRYKDIKNWWSNPHYDRPGGVEVTSSTPWVPQSKPIWFTETGCPAIDKGANQPNVFYDPKSSESFYPYYSNGMRDDFIQRRYVDAVTAHWAATGAHNPVSNIYGKTMVDTEQIFVWAWDARPYPAFPYQLDVWSDGLNYQTGHWLNGRLGSVSVAALVAAILSEYGFHAYDTSALEGVIDGFAIDHTMSARQAIEPLAQTFSFDGLETEGVLKFITRSASPVATIMQENLVEVQSDQPVLTQTRAQETDLPNRLQMLFLDGENDYRQSAVETRKLTGQSLRDVVRQAPFAMPYATAQARCATALFEVWAGRETASFVLPVSCLSLEPGDIVDLDILDHTRQYRIEEISEAGPRTAKARLIDQSVFSSPVVARKSLFVDAPGVYGPPLYYILDLPMLHAQTNPYAPWLAVRASPWPGALSLLENTGGSFSEIDRINAGSVIGRTLNVLNAGPAARIDYANKFQVQFTGSEVESITTEQFLAGQNVIALGDQENGWEIIQFQNAELIGTNTYELSVLLRGQSGSEKQILSSRAIGSICVLLDDTVRQIPTQASDLGRERIFRLGPSMRDSADPSFVEFSHTPPGNGLRPFSPVHLDVEVKIDRHRLSWIRRTRIDGDSWFPPQVPLGETSESYRVEILDGNQIVRTFEVETNSVDYLDADRLVDFDQGLPDTISFRVAQISSSYGVGEYEETTINV